MNRVVYHLLKGKENAKTAHLLAKELCVSVSVVRQMIRAAKQEINIGVDRNGYFIVDGAGYSARGGQMSRQYTVIDTPYDRVEPPKSKPFDLKVGDIVKFDVQINGWNDRRASVITAIYDSFCLTELPSGIRQCFLKVDYTHTGDVVRVGR